MNHFLWLLLLPALCFAQVASTRVSPYDFQCQDSAGAKISDHQRFDSAFVACLNAPNGAYVQGGRYRITKIVVGPSGTAKLDWIAPTQDTAGKPVSITGYRIHYGVKSDELIQVVQIVPATTYTFSGLAPGTYYFAVRALAANVAESDLSNVAAKTVS